MRRTIFGFHALLAIALVVSLVGCPRPSAPGKVFVLLTSSDEAKAGVPVADIASLTVTITEISLVPTDDVEDPETEVPAEEGGTEDSEQPVVFSGAMDVNLLDLTDVSAVLSSAEIAPGTYGQIRMKIENPRLTLTAAPEVEITDIQLTANSRLFISGDFEIAAGEEQLLVLNFGGIHLQETGSGKYVLTPQLRAEVATSDASGMVVGTVTSVDDTTLVVTLEDGTTVSVAYAGASIFLPADTDTATGTTADLVVDKTVEVQGLFSVDGSMTAQSIRIYEDVTPPPAG